MTFRRHPDDGRAMGGMAVTVVGCAGLGGNADAVATIAERVRLVRCDDRGRELS